MHTSDRDRIKQEYDKAILDVRTPKEWRQGRIEGSVNIPLNHLVERIAEVPRDRPVLVYCAGGYRSSIAAGLLQRHGEEFRFVRRVKSR